MLSIPATPLNTLLRFLLLAFTVSTAHAAPIKVVTWNLEWFPGKQPDASKQDAKSHMKEAREALQKINPDVFIGVEIRDWAGFDELVSAVPGLKTHVVSSFVDPETGLIRPQQLAIASKLVCQAASWEPWIVNMPDSSRGYSFAALENEKQELIMIQAVHLKSNGGEAPDVAAIRIDQTRQLIAQRALLEKAFSEHKIAGWIATGDFNTNHDGQFPLCKVVEEMTAAGFHNTWADVPKKDRLTWINPPESRFEPTTFDYFFTIGLGNLKAVTLNSPEKISDHRAIQLIIP